MTLNNIESLEEYNEIINSNRGVVVYFSHQKCNVCKVLKPKIFKLLQKNFAEILFAYSDTVLYPDIAAQNSVFTVPTILVYFDKKEFIRKSRNIGVDEFRKELERPYKLMFN